MSKDAPQEALAGDGSYVDLRLVSEALDALRRTLAALLRERLALQARPRNPAKPSHYANFGLEAASDVRLTEWMHANLSLSA